MTSMDWFHRQERCLKQAEALALAAYYLPGFGRPELAVELSDLAKRVLSGAVEFDVMATIDFATGKRGTPPA
jgi:hypothetical protein